MADDSEKPVLEGVRSNHPGPVADDSEKPALEGVRSNRLGSAADDSEKPALEGVRSNRPGSARSSRRSNSSISSVSPTNSFIAQPIRPAPLQGETTGLHAVVSQKSEDELLRILSRRKTDATLQQDPEVNAEIQNLLSSIFGSSRRGEEETRHLGVVFRDLTVKGMGLGARVLPTNGDPLLAPFRALRGLFRKGGGGHGSKPPVRTLIDSFSGCIKPGEMLLVLGRPGSGKLLSAIVI